jgi:hypothetical protein
MDFSHISNWLPYILLAWLAISMIATPIIGRFLSTPPSKSHVEATFDNATTPTVLGELAAACLGRGAVIVNQTDYQLVCQRALPPDDALLPQLMIGNSYSTTPINKICFNAALIGTGVRVQAYQWIETQMAFGQVQTVEMNGNGQFNSVESLLTAAGGHP